MEAKAEGEESKGTEKGDDFTAASSCSSEIGAVQVATVNENETGLAEEATDDEGQEGDSGKEVPKVAIAVAVAFNAGSCEHDEVAEESGASENDSDDCSGREADRFSSRSKPLVSLQRLAKRARHTHSTHMHDSYDNMP